MDQTQTRDTEEIPLFYVTKGNIMYLTDDLISNKLCDSTLCTCGGVGGGGVGTGA